MMISNVTGEFTSINVGAATISTREPQRDAQFGSADFFHVEKHSALNFNSTSIGRVRNARPKRPIAIRAHSGPWWVRPGTDRPFIPIKEDAKWSTETRLGFEYAALLVEPDFHPLPAIDVAPIQSGTVPLARANQRLIPDEGERSCRART